MLQTRAVEPLTIKTAGGQEMSLLLTAGSLLRTKRAFGAKSTAELFSSQGANPQNSSVDQEELALRLIYESLDQSVRTKLSFEAFCDQIPLDPAFLSEVITALFAMHGAGDAPKNEQPPTPTTT